MAEPAPRPLRIALVDPSLFTLPYDRALAQGLRDAGHQVTLYGRRPRAAEAEDGADGLVASFYPFAESSFGAALPGPLRLGLKGVDHLLSMARLRRRLAAPATRPDVIHFQWLPLPFADRRLLGGFRAIAPLVLTVHDTDPFNGNPASRLQRFGAAACFDSFDRLVVHTEQGRARLIGRGIAPARIALLPHGLLTAPLARGPDALDAPVTFLCFGKMKPYKGLDIAIEGFARLPPALRQRARLRIVGEPHMDVAPLLALAEARGVAAQVAIEPRFVQEAEFPALFGGGVVALFPYREIEASGVLSLALAHGRPIVASRLGGFAEALRDGVHGLLVPPGDADALSDAMARLLADPGFAARCALAVEALAMDMPGWAEIGRRTASLYVALLPRAAAPRAA